MLKVNIVLLLLFFYFTGFSQTVLKEGFSSNNIYDVDFIAKTKGGNFIGMYEGGGSAYPYTFVFDKRLKNRERLRLNNISSKHLGFYHDDDNLIHLYTVSLLKITKIVHEGKGGKSAKSIFKVPNGTAVSTQFVGNSIISLDTDHRAFRKRSMVGYKYNFVTGEREFKVRDKESIGRKVNYLRVFSLKSGKILVIGEIHKFQPQGAYGLGPESNGLRFTLYNSEINFITSVTREDKLHYDNSKAYSFESNTEEGDVIYFWARDMKSNKMSIFKISVDGDNINISENELIQENIEMVYMNEKIDEKQYTEIFSALVTNMAPDRKKDTQGDDYILDSTYTIDNQTYNSYHVVQNIKGKTSGAFVLVGVFVLNESGAVVKNMVVDFQFHPEDPKMIPKYGDEEQFQMFYKRHRVQPFFDGNKIRYFYVVNSNLTGFEINETGEILRLPEIPVDYPTGNKGAKIPFVHTILPLDDHSFFLKARHANVGKEGIANIS